MSEADTRAAEPEEIDPEKGESGKFRTSRLRRPTVVEAAAFVALVGGVVTLVFTFNPGCKPQPPSEVSKATISNIEVIPRVTFRRFLLRQFGKVPPGYSETYLARRGAMVNFDWEINGLRGKHLPFGWELSDYATNERIAGELTPYQLTPSENDDSGSWAVWMHGQQPGRRYYGTVTIYKPEGPPYELKHFQTRIFRGFASN
jgi:hypothetical protein